MDIYLTQNFNIGNTGADFVLICIGNNSHVDLIIYLY